MKPDTTIQGLARPGRRRRGRRLLLACALLVLATVIYGFAGIYGGPKLIERGLTQSLDAAAAGALSFDTITFNPFTLVADIGGLELGGGASGTRFAAARIQLNFAAVGLPARRPVLTAVTVVEPELDVGSVAALPALARRLRARVLGQARIDRFELSGGVLRVGDGPALAPISLLLNDFDAGGDANARYRLTAGSDAGTRLLSFGSVSPDLERADGELTLDGADVARLADPLGEIVAAAMPAGRLSLGATLTAEQLLGAARVTLDAAEFSLFEFRLAPAAGITVSSDLLAGTANLVIAGAGSRLNMSGRIEIGEAALLAVDELAQPAQRYSLPQAAILVTADSAGDGLTINLGGPLATAGDAAVTVRVPATAAEATRVTLSAAQLPARVLSAYSMAALERGVTAGSADLETEYAVNGEAVDGKLELVASGIEFAAAPAGDGAAADTAPALELAAALLEDADGVVAIELPFAGSGLPAREAAAAALRARFAAMTETPFEALAPLLAGEPGDAGAVPFQPGDAALNDRALASIGQLARVLGERPRLGLRVHGGYAAGADRDALARQQIQLHVELATAGASATARSVDFGSARAQDVLDEFAGERLPPARVEELKRRFECEGAMLPLCRRAYYELLFDALVENEEITATTLTRLGRFRAASVADALTAAGIAAERIEIVPNSEVVSSPFGVGLRVELTAAGSP